MAEDEVLVELDAALSIEVDVEQLAMPQGLGDAVHEVEPGHLLVADLRVEPDQLAPVQCGDGFLLVASLVGLAGICGSDLHMREMPAIPAGIVLGHEFTGIITETGRAVTGWTAGDRVAANPFDPCGQCETCAAGYPELCPTNTKRGIGLRSLLRRLRRDSGRAAGEPVPAAGRGRDEHGAIAEPLAVGLHGVNLAQADPSEPCVVLGGGPIGIMTALGLRAKGFENVIVVEPTEVRRETLRKIGFAVTDVKGQDDNVRDVLGGPPHVALGSTAIRWASARPSAWSLRRAAW